MKDVIKLENFNLKFQWSSDWTHVWLTSRALSVDAFFVFSGTLVSYSFMKERSKGKKFNLPFHFIHRYLRLTPAFAIMLLFNATLYNRIGSGPLWKTHSQRIEDECRNNWWKYLLFINNWFPIRKVCLWDVNETDRQDEKCCNTRSKVYFMKYIPRDQVALLTYFVEHTDRGRKAQFHLRLAKFSYIPMLL